MGLNRLKNIYSLDIDDSNLDYEIFPVDFESHDVVAFPGLEPVTKTETNLPF
jgi:hypothetical protein